MNLGDIYDRVLDTLRAEFPAYATVDDYRELGEDRTKLAVPALLVELTDLERAPAEDPATGQKAVVAIFEATVILGFRTPAVDRALRTAAGNLIAFIDGQRWRTDASPSLIDVMPARVTVAGPHEFMVVTGALLAWRVEWRQMLFLGNDGTDDGGGTLPETVLVSWAPAIGPAHVGDYDPLGDLGGLGDDQP